MLHRVMDAVDPELVEELEHVAEDAAQALPGVRAVSDLRVRWLGHALHSELSLTVDGRLSTRQSHDHAEEVRHAMFHAKPQLTSIIIHVEPDGSGEDDPHFMTAHHGVKRTTTAPQPHQH
jgi:divalent metal cation (Fe/Co/Zn/Cd) transporter